jgi:hypothetical protein
MLKSFLLAVLFCLAMGVPLCACSTRPAITDRNSGGISSLEHEALAALVWKQIHPDTSRNYIISIDTVVIDSVWTGMCEDYSSLQGLTRIATRGLVNYSVDQYGIPGCPARWYDIWARIDTTWSSKVQVWLTPDWVRVLERVLRDNAPCRLVGHDWLHTTSTLRSQGASTADYSCTRCNENKEVFIENFLGDSQ